MFSRVARYQIPEENLDAAIGAFEQAMNELREIEGCEGGYLLVDRDNSTAISVTFWADRTSLEASEVRASRLRSQAVGPYGGEIQAVDRCEVAFDLSEVARAT